MDPKMEKVNALLADETFGKSIEGIETVEGLQKVFAKNGVELTAKEVENICQSVSVYSSEDELGENDLDGVAGGLLVPMMLGGISPLVKIVVNTILKK